MKKLILLLTIIMSLSFMGCGGGESSKEAKELLQKILQVVGIPHNIIVNICQDGNENGICENFELQTKITLNKGDSFDDILEKISLTPDGKYFLETRDITKPILLELQDSANVAYDSGKFTIPFNGFKNNENNEIKEISILASMVDENYLNDSELTSIRHLNNKDTQDKFYAKLLEGLENNINTLRAIGLNPQDAMSTNIKEMANQLITDGVKDRLPEDLSRCGVDNECVDRRLDTLSNQIEISATEAESIKVERDSTPTPTPTPTPASTTQNNKKGLLVSKMIEVHNVGGSNDKTTTTYEYNNKKQIIKEISNSTYDNSEDICTYNYDSRDRFIGEVCSDTTKNLSGQTEITNSNTDIIYKDNKIYEWLSYDNNGHLSSSWKVLEWSGNKAIRWEIISFDSETGREESRFTWSATYTDDNPTHLESSTKDISWSTDRKFDNKKTPYYYSWEQQNELSSWLGWFGNKNNIIEESTTTNYNDINNITTIKNKIQYNSGDMPIRIDSTTTNSSNNYTTTSYTIYEYIEAK